MPDSKSEPILDCHAHVFPPQVAAKAVASIGAFYDLPMGGGGTAQDLVRVSRKAGITHSIIFSTATRLEQVAAINRFMVICQKSEPSFTAFGTLHPAMSESETAAVLDQIAAAGLKGVKLHPDFQNIEADSPFVIHATRLMAGRLILLLHAGDNRHDYSQPDRIRRLAEACPDTVIIAAHLGGWSQWQEAADKLADIDRLLVDTSSTLKFIDSEEAAGLIRRFGIRRVLFGTDYPMWDPAAEMARFNQLPLNAAERRAILWENGNRLLRLV
ncbi:MAG: amidohydrolase family protein [Clostridiaceae bacterium]|nr:amidohydrolase family protein [Clostridiaceae bacterium]